MTNDRKKDLFSADIPLASELSEYVLEGDLLEVLEEELAEAHALAEATASVSEQPSTSEAL